MAACVKPALAHADAEYGAPFTGQLPSSQLPGIAKIVAVGKYSQGMH